MTINFLVPIQITDYPLSIDNLLVNRKGTRLAFSCQVYANLSIQQTADRQKTEKARGSLIYKFDKLLIRFWDEYIIGPRHHPFIVSINRNTKGIFYFLSPPTDILYGIDVDSPSRYLDDGKTHWSFSASGNKFAYSRQHDETSAAAWSTNFDIYTVDLTASKLISVCITCENLAADGNPRYSPIDEHVLVYQSQSSPGYGADQVKMKWYNGMCYSSFNELLFSIHLGSDTKRTLLDNWDRSIKAITWSLDGQSLFIELGEEAHDVIYKLSNISASSSVPIRLISSGSSHDVNIHPTNNEIFLFNHGSLTQPKNIYLYKSFTSIRPITVHNHNLLNKVRMSPVVETFNFTGARGDIVWGWHVQPVNGTAKKAPLAFLIHGGPQASWYDAWDYLYNFQVFASQGYAVIGINFHGSDSYGQNFTNSIIGQYSTLPYEDLQIGLTEVLKRYNYIDENRVVALGSSYGGYMVNWISGHPEMSRRFRTLISDAGIFDLRSFAYSLDWIGVIEHAVGGFIPYEKPEIYEKFNPINHVANWSQPMLIIHRGRDYRVPDTQGISAFTALQRRGIPSRMVYFPLENHGISNPISSLDWHQEVFDWMKKWIA
jgi:dipeptidyl aminopeptidase/acylaminoacyl peptidase